MQHSNFLTQWMGEEEWSGATLTALHYIFCNQNLKEFLHIRIWCELQDLALIAYPPPVDLPIAPLNEEVTSDPQRVDRGNERRNLATMERVGHGIRLFKKSMPIFIRLKFLEEPEISTRKDLCTEAREFFLENWVHWMTCRGMVLMNWILIMPIKFLTL